MPFYFSLSFSYNVIYLSGSKCISCSALKRFPFREDPGFPTHEVKVAEWKEEVEGEEKTGEERRGAEGLFVSLVQVDKMST